MYPKQSNNISVLNKFVFLLFFVCLENEINFDFIQTELIGLSILLLIEDSERDGFLKFLNNPSQANDTCCARMMTNNSNEYRQVQVHRKKKLNQDTIGS